MERQILEHLKTETFACGPVTWTIRAERDVWSGDIVMTLQRAGRASPYIRFGWVELAVLLENLQKFRKVEMP